MWDEPIRVALIAPFGLRSKGTTRARVLPLARALARRGNDVALFIPPYDSPEDAGRVWEENGVRIVNIALPRPRVESALWHLLLAWRLFHAVRAWHPDVVHAFKPKGPSGLVAAALWMMGGGHLRRIADDLSPAQFPRLPFSLSPSVLVIDSDDWEGPGGWNDDPRAGYSWLQRRFFAWQERFGLSHADAWTVASRCLRARAIAFGAEPARVLVLPNGLSDPPQCQSLRSATRNPKSALLYTRFAGVSVSDVVAIWERVWAAVPTATLTVIGHGPDGEEAMLAGLPGVTVLGWLSPDQVSAHLGEVAVAMVPWADKPTNRARHSVKILELMAAGVPVVAYAVGELPETLGEAGVLIRSGDPDAFAAALVGLLADPRRAARLSEMAQERVRARFCWDRLAETVLAAYASAGKSAGRTA